MSHLDLKARQAHVVHIFVGVRVCGEHKSPCVPVLVGVRVCVCMKACVLVGLGVCMPVYGILLLCADINMRLGQSTDLHSTGPQMVHVPRGLYILCRDFWNLPSANEAV